MGYEMEITERLQHAIVNALRNEMALGWSLDQLVPMLHNCVDDAIEEIEGER